MHVTQYCIEHCLSRGIFPANITNYETVAEGFILDVVAALDVFPLSLIIAEYTLSSQSSVDCIRPDSINYQLPKL